MCHPWWAQWHHSAGLAVGVRAGPGGPVGRLAIDTQAPWLLEQHMTPSGTTKGTFGSFVLTLMLVQVLSVGFSSLPSHVSSFLVSVSGQTILHRLPVPAGVRAGTVRLGLLAPPGQSPRQHRKEKDIGQFVSSRLNSCTIHHSIRQLRLRETFKEL